MLFAQVFHRRAHALTRIVTNSPRAEARRRRELWELRCLILS